MEHKIGGYNRRLILNFAKISKPLTRVLQEDEQFYFNSDFNKSFEELE